jgi:DNA repair exonuclease SbcCD ATPase subunit
MIEFVSVKFKNFGSFGNNYSEIKLNNNKTTLVTGTNGNGKSFALLDSLCFGLFGKPFRPINIPQLVNSVNNRHCMVEIEFKRSGSTYIVKRGLSPKIFEIYKDGEMLDQHAKSKDYQEHFEEQILGFDYAAFKQVVILGKSNFIPFMQLTPNERRKIIEGLLDLDILADMNVYVRGELSKLKTEISEEESFVKIAHEKVKSLNELKTQIDNTKNLELAEYEDKIVELKASVDSEETFIKNTVTELADLENLKKQHSSRIASMAGVPTMHSKALELQESLIGQINTLETDPKCTCCGQTLPEEARQKHLEEKREKLATCKKSLQVGDKKLKELENLKAEVETLNKKILELNILQAQGVTRKNGFNNEILSLNQKIAKIKKTSTESEINIKIEEAIAEKDKHAKALESAISKQIHHDVVYDILKDGGLKSRIIKHYVPIINGLVNKFLGKLNLYVDFNIDEEFKETIKSRYRDAFSYSSFSEGEKQRIDLAILLTWREIAKMKNSLNCNLLIFDEILDSSLDSTGTESFLKLLNKMKSKCSIFIISHKADALTDKFDQQMQFEKKNNFSRIKAQV